MIINKHFQCINKLLKTTVYNLESFHSLFKIPEDIEKNILYPSYHYSTASLAIRTFSNFAPHIRF